MVAHGGDAAALAFQGGNNRHGLSQFDDQALVIEIVQFAVGNLRLFYIGNGQG